MNKKLNGKNVWEEFLKDSSRSTLDFCVKRCGMEPLLFKPLLDLIIEEKYPASVRASRVVCNSMEENPEIFGCYLGEILKILSKISNDSIKFNLLKIFTFFKLPVDDDDLGELANICFDSMENRTKRAAVKVYAIDILYRISRIVPELQPELIILIEKHLIGASPGFINRAGKILKRLNYPE